MEILQKYADLVIFSVLGLMAFGALYCVVERLLFLRKARPQNYATQEDFDEALSENMTLLNSIYSNAPYVGLLGTVVGIMLTFYEMGVSGQIEVKSVLIGLSLALKATALGLLIAIPALFAYNLLYGRIHKLSAAFNKGAR